MDAFLRQVAHARVLRHEDVSVIRLLLPHDAFHQGGLAGAIFACEGDAIPALHHEGEPIKKHARTELDAQVTDG